MMEMLKAGMGFGGRAGYTGFRIRMSYTSWTEAVLDGVGEADCMLLHLACSRSVSVGVTAINSNMEYNHVSWRTSCDIVSGR